MSHLKLRSEVETRTRNQLSANYPDVDIRIENVDMDNEDTPSDVVVVAVTMMPGRTFVTTIGRKSRRLIGMVQFDILVAKDTATGLRDEIGEFLGDYFSAKEIQLPAAYGRTTFDEPEYKNLGLQNGKYRLAVSVTYEIDQCF